jgi:RNA polymerase sigma factor (sigma-70 family)
MGCRPRLVDREFDTRVARSGGALLSSICRGDEDLAAVPSIGRANRIEGHAPPETDATRALYEQYANQVFRYCLHQLGSREEAEDAVQSTFLNAFRGLKRGVVPELESAWLFKIAHNVCLSRRRSSWRRGRIESPADFELVEELTPAPSRRAEELIGLQDVLEQMPETQRRAILLREWQGLSYREIAGELDLSQAAVETLIFRARRTLASGLEQPPARPRRRVLRMLDLGNAAAAVKSLLVGGGAAAKIAGAVAVVGATAVVAAAPTAHHQVQYRSHTPPPRPAPQPVQARAHASLPAAAAVLATGVDRHVVRNAIRNPGSRARPAASHTLVPAARRAVKSVSVQPTANASGPARPSFAPGSQKAHDVPKAPRTGKSHTKDSANAHRRSPKRAGGSRPVAAADPGATEGPTDKTSEPTGGSMGHGRQQADPTSAPEVEPVHPVAARESSQDKGSDS